MQDIDYPNAEKQTLTSITAEDIENHFKNLKDENKALYNDQYNKARNDILDMINGSREITKYLGRGKIFFSEEDVDSYKKFIVDKYSSRAVKEIIIYSKELKGLENAIIYDLPGFDSPTFKHSEFTISKVRQADAVVMLRDINPSITGPELQIINETREEDGVELKEKLFFFINKIDTLHTKERFEEVLEKFKKELREYNLYKDGRIFYGSALAHLYEIGQDLSEDAKSSHEILKARFGIENSIGKLYQGIVEYNHTERRSVLQRRLNAFKVSIENFLKEIKEILQSRIKYENSYKKSGEHILSLKRKSTSYIEEELENTLAKLKQKLKKEKTMSGKLKAFIDQKINMLSEEELEKIRLNVERISSSSEALPDAFNRKVREKIREQIISSFTISLGEILKEESENFRNQVVEIFINALEPSGDKEKVKELVKKFLDENVAPFLNESSLELIVDRFSGHIIELMTMPLTSIDRLNKFKEVQRDIYSVLVFDENFDLNIPPVKQPIIYRILYQDATAEDFKGKLKELFSLSDKDIEEIVNKAVRELVPYGLIISKLINYKDRIKEKYNILSIVSSFDSDTGSYHEEFRKRLNPPQNYEEVKKEIETDLNNLKQILKACVVNAIDLENAFIIKSTKYTNLIISLIKNEPYDKFLNDNFDVIKKAESELLIKQETESQNIKRVVKDIENLIDKLNNRR